MQDADGEAAALLRPRLALAPIEMGEFDFADLDGWMREADQVIRRSQAVLDRFAPAPGPAVLPPDAA